MATTVSSKRPSADATEIRDALVRLCDALDKQTPRYLKSQNVLDSFAWAKQLLGPAQRPDPRDE